VSRIGKLPIEVPKGVTVSISGRMVEVKGPKGTLSRTIPGKIAVKVSQGIVEAVRPDDSRRNRAFHGLVRALVQNMVTGVSVGYSKELEIVGVGYRAETTNGKVLSLSVGHSHPVKLTMPEGVAVAVENRGVKIRLSGIDKEKVGQMAANVRAMRPPEPYKGKGIRLADEHVRRKVGKTGAA